MLWATPTALQALQTEVEDLRAETQILRVLLGELVRQHHESTQVLEILSQDLLDRRRTFQMQLSRN